MHSVRFWDSASSIVFHSISPMVYIRLVMHALAPPPSFSVFSEAATPQQCKHPVFLSCRCSMFVAQEGKCTALALQRGPRTRGLGRSPTSTATNRASASCPKENPGWKMVRKSHLSLNPCRRIRKHFTFPFPDACSACTSDCNPKPK